MQNSLIHYIDEIISSSKVKALQSKKKGWVMSEIIQEVDKQLGSHAAKIARERILKNLKIS